MRTLNLADAHELLTSNATVDNAKHMKMLYAGAKGGFGNDSLLCEYVDCIYNDTDKWLQGFPESLKSLTAVSKPKTAFLKLLTLPAVMADLGPQRCFDVADAVSDSYKKLAKDISNRRLICDAEKSHNVEEEDQSNSKLKVNHDRKQVQVQKTRVGEVEEVGEGESGIPVVQASQQALEEKVIALARMVKDLSAMLEDAFVARA